MPTPVRPMLAVVAAGMSALSLGCQSADEEDAAELAPIAASALSIDAGVVDVDAGPGDAGDAGSPRDASAPRLPQPTVVLRPPNVPYVASFRANGLGCPAGTWTAALVPDDESYEITFDAYDAAVIDGRRNSFKDCLVTLTLASPTGFSAAVTAFRYEGVSNLGDDVRAFALATHYFAGSPVPSNRDGRVELAGPTEERPYAWASDITSMDTVWTPCGRDRSIQMPTRLGVQKSQNVGVGSIALSRLRFKLAWRACGG